MLFKKKPAAQPEYAPAPGTEIRYSPELIPQLLDDHAFLYKTYEKIQQCFAQKDYRSVAKLLGEFRSTLQGHVLKENVRLYIYLERTLGRHPTSGELIQEFRREMDGIARTVMTFLKKYEALDVDRNLAASFKQDFTALGELLTQRLKREEGTLYPLYMPNV